MLNVDFHDFASVAAGDFDRRLVGFQFNEPLILLDNVAFPDEHFQNVAGVDPFAEFGQFDVNGHEEGLGIRVWGLERDRKSVV